MLFRFVRHWSRRAIAGNATDGQHGRHVWVTEAVASCAADGDVTVNDVAAELGIDQSGASRMLSAADRVGYVEIASSRIDARRRVVSVTASGRVLLDQAHAWQESVFAELTRDWTPDERAAFHRDMLRLVASSAERQIG